MRYTSAEHDAFARDFNRDSCVVLPQHFPRETLEKWRLAFEPLLQEAITKERDNPNRGSERYYVTLPFTGLFADAAIYEDADILAIVERVAGPQPVMCQLAADTPLKGSEFQEWHADTPPLFPELGHNDTPSFQLAVNFPLCDVTEENGPFEGALGTHRMRKEEVLAGIQNGSMKTATLMMTLGDVVIRDVRAIHRGTPNRTDTPRPMVVIGYSRRWLHRPEVHIRVPRSTWETLSPKGRELLRFNPVVEDAALGQATESYRAFAY